MNTCASERQLVELATGDADAATRAHAAACAVCAERLTALERDLSLLRVALRGAPAPAAVRRRPWRPVAALAAMTAALLLFSLPTTRTVAPLGAASGEASAELSDALTNALFADASFDGGDSASDDRDLAAALNGGALCNGSYGDDCSAEVLLASYD